MEGSLKPLTSTFQFTVSGIVRCSYPRTTEIKPPGGSANLPAQPITHTFWHANRNYGFAQQNHRIEVNPTMSTLKNLPTEKAQPLDHLIDIREHQVVSMSLSNSDYVRMTMLAFADGEDVREEEYPGDTMYVLLDGEAYIYTKDQNYPLQKGETLMIPEGISHGVKGNGAFKIMQITVTG